MWPRGNCGRSHKGNPTLPGSWQTWSYSLPMGRCSWTSHPSKNGSVTTASTMNETSALNSIMIVRWTTTSWLILIRPLVAPPHGSLSPTRLHQNLSGVPILPLSTIMTLVMRLTTLTMVVTGNSGLYVILPLWFFSIASHSHGD